MKKIALWAGSSTPSDDDYLQEPHRRYQKPIGMAIREQRDPNGHACQHHDKLRDRNAQIQHLNVQIADLEPLSLMMVTCRTHGHHKAVAWQDFCTILQLEAVSSF